MVNHTFSAPDLSSFCQLNKLGLEATGQHIDKEHAIIECRFTKAPEPCTKCGNFGSSRGSVSRRLAHVPYGQRPTTLLLRIRRWHCANCKHFWLEDSSRAGPPRLKLSHGAIQWALAAIVVDHLSVSRVADHLNVSWHTANSAIINEGERLLFNDPTRFDGVRDGIEVVAMDGFSGFKSASDETLKNALTVLDLFHVVRWAGNALDNCRRRVQQNTLGRRGHKEDPLFKQRRSLLTRINYLSDGQRFKLGRLFNDKRHQAVEGSWSMYQDVVAAYNHPVRRQGKKRMRELIDMITDPCLPRELEEIKRLGRTMKKYASSILAYFDRPGTSNGPTEAINGRLEHLRGIALGFRNITNYIVRCLLESGGFKTKLHP